MKISANPVGNTINQYMMKAALPFGAYFIVEYLVRNFSATNLLLGFLNIPLMFGTAVILFCLVKRIRDRILDGKVSGFLAWTFGTQLMLYSGLIEATFIYIFNKFFAPNNLAEVHHATIAQYENLLEQIHAMPNSSALVASMTDTLQQTVALLKEAPVASAIESAMTMLSNDIFIGMLLMAIIAPMVRKK